MLVATDSSSARSVAMRQCPGRLRHLEVSMLWLQHFVKNNFLEFVEVNGTVTSPDLQIKVGPKQKFLE